MSPLLEALIPAPSATDLADEEQAFLLALEALLEPVAENAAAVDRAGRYPTAAVALLKDTPLLTASLPTDLGGSGAGHRFSLEAQLRLATADSAVAQVFKVHDELVREIFRYAPQDQRERLAALVRDERAIIGLAVAEAGKTAESPITTTANPTGNGGFVLNGTKIYTTGAAEADHVAVWAFNAEQATEVAPVLGMQLLLVPKDTHGMTVLRDWDVMGQRGTDSGTVTFENVACPPEWVASVPGAGPLPHASLRYQAGFAAVLTGIGLGALHAARRFVATSSRPWAAAGVANAADDPLLQRKTGELAASLAGAYAATMATAPLLDACDRGQLPREQLALPVSAARVLSHRAALDATGEIHGLMGTRSVATKYGFDRWWRNARTLSLHDPVHYKELELGRHLLTGWVPEPGVYQ